MIIYLTDKSDEKPNYNISFEEFIRDYLQINIPWYQGKFIKELERNHLVRGLRNERLVEKLLHCPRCKYYNEPKNIRIIESQYDIFEIKTDEPLPAEVHKIARLDCEQCGYIRMTILE